MQPSARRPYINLMREAWVAPTRAQAADSWLERAFKFHRYYWETGTKGDAHDPVLQRVAAGENVDLETFVHDRAIVGTPEDCVAELKRWHDAIGFDEITLLFLVRSRPSQELDDSVRLFANEVMPAFRLESGSRLRRFGAFASSVSSAGSIRRCAPRLALRASAGATRLAERSARLPSAWRAPRAGLRGLNGPRRE